MSGQKTLTRPKGYCAATYRRSLIAERYSVTLPPGPVKIFVCFDGVHLVKSSSSQFWVVVGYFPCKKTHRLLSLGYFMHLKNRKTVMNFSLHLLKKLKVFLKLGLTFMGDVLR